MANVFSRWRRWRVGPIRAASILATRAEQKDGAENHVLHSHALRFERSTSVCLAQSPDAVVER
jgi:hypothetical protein